MHARNSFVWRACVRVSMGLCEHISSVCCVCMTSPPLDKIAHTYEVFVKYLFDWWFERLGRLSCLPTIIPFHPFIFRNQVLYRSMRLPKTPLHINWYFYSKKTFRPFPDRRGTAFMGRSTSHHQAVITVDFITQCSAHLTTVASRESKWNVVLLLIICTWLRRAMKNDRASQLA